jgi:hypothetical protein
MTEKHTPEATISGFEKPGAVNPHSSFTWGATITMPSSFPQRTSHDLCGLTLTGAVPYRSGLF